MDAETLYELLKSVVEQCKPAVTEVNTKFQENVEWLTEIGEVIEKHTSKSSFLLPKTPTASRRLRKRVRPPCIPEFDESTCSTGSTDSSYSKRSTRSTRNTRQNTVKLSPVLSTRLTRTKSKATSKKIRQVESRISESTECSSDVCERQNKRTSVDEIGKKECPSKVRKVDVPGPLVLIERLEINRPTVTIKSPASTSVQDVIGTEATDSSRSKQKVNNELSVKSMFPLVERLRPSNISSTSNNITEQVESTHEIILTEVSQAERNGEKSDHQNTDETLVTSTVTEEISEEISSVPLNSTVTLSKNTVGESTSHSSHSIVSLVDKESPKPDKEQLKPITSTDSIPDMFDDNIDNHGNFNGEECTTEPIINSTLDDSMGSPANLTINDISDSEEHETESEEIVPVEKNHEIEFCSVVALEQNKTLKLSNCRPAAPSAPKKISKPQEQSQKPTVVFSPYANEPVRERVAAFERLQTVSEESVQKSPQKEVQQPMRVTRTKTRAMAKAEAAAAATAESSGTSTTANVPQGSNSKKQLSENAWMASRKSLAKAKKICTAKDKRQNPSPEEHELSKENSTLHLSSKYTPYIASSGSKYRNTPLSSSNISNTSMNSVNRLYTVGSASKVFAKKNSGNIVVGVESFLSKKTPKYTHEDLQEMKEEVLRKRKEKAEEMRKQREQYTKEKIEQKKRLREAKMMKVWKTREALEKQKQDQELFVQKVKEEKLKEKLQEREEKMKEQMQQKKMYALQKAAEIEERRKQEEAARLARLKEQEEEQRRQQAARIREQEEAERHYQKRLAEEKQVAMIMQQAVKYDQMQAKLVKEKQKEKTEIKPKTAPAKPVLDKTFDMPHSSKSPLKKIPNINDYGIDSSTGDSSEDEEKPKRAIPLWARKEERKPALKKLVFKVKDLHEKFFTCEKSPDIMGMFRQYGIKQRVRTSSAVWRTPPRYSTLPKF